MTFQEFLEVDQRWSAKLSVSDRPGAIRTLAAGLAHSGDSWFWGAGLVLVWLAGDSEWKAWAIRLFVAIVVTAVMVLLLKFIFRRQRPEGSWGSIYRQNDPHSFPSGHAARAFMLAVLIVGLGPTWLIPVMLVWAPLVTLSRVAMDLHFLSDAVAGAVLGVVVAIAILALI